MKKEKNNNRTISIILMSIIIVLLIFIAVFLVIRLRPASSGKDGSRRNHGEQVQKADDSQENADSGPENHKKKHPRGEHIKKSDRILLEQENYEYTGQEILPVPKVMLRDSGLVDPSEYTIEYSDDTITPGTASLTIVFNDSSLEPISTTYDIQLQSSSITSAADEAGGMATVSWTPALHVTGYQIGYKAQGADEWQTLDLEDGTADSAELTDLLPDTLYEIKIRSHLLLDGLDYYSSVSDPVSLKTSSFARKSSVKEFLQTGLEPLGTTLYVWGGGWNEEDTGAGETTTKLGVDSRWKAFFDANDSTYDFNDTRYQINDGLDCSGYIGWMIYNIVNTEDGLDGYVMSSTEMSQTFASYGWGSYTDAVAVTDHKAGDICSTNGHVYVVIGTCSDGSVVLMHASPPGVQISGTVTPSGSEDSEAYRLACHYMETYYPEFYQRYGSKPMLLSYLTDYSTFRWDTSGTSLMRDPEGYQELGPEAILKDLLGE